MTRKPRVCLNRERVRTQGLLARLDRDVEAVAVPLGRQVGRELCDEEAPVREYEDAERARGIDEAGGGNRLARSSRMAEAVPADRTRILLRCQLDLVFVVVGVGERFV